MMGNIEAKHDSDERIDGQQQGRGAGRARVGSQKQRAWRTRLSWPRTWYSSIVGARRSARRGGNRGRSGPTRSHSKAKVSSRSDKGVPVVVAREVDFFQISIKVCPIEWHRRRELQWYCIQRWHGRCAAAEVSQSESNIQLREMEEQKWVYPIKSGALSLASTWLLLSMSLPLAVGKTLSMWIRQADNLMDEFADESLKQTSNDEPDGHLMSKLPNNKKNASSRLPWRENKDDRTRYFCRYIRRSAVRLDAALLPTPLINAFLSHHLAFSAASSTRVLNSLDLHSLSALLKRRLRDW